MVKNDTSTRLVRKGSMSLSGGRTTISKRQWIWRQNDYLKAAVDEIQWIEAAGSYSRIHLTGGRILVISFNLASVRRKLSESDFIRIHRSRIVNLRHVETLVGNSLKIGNELFIFLGVRINIRKSLAVWDSCCIFAATNSATLPVEQRTRAELLLYIDLWNTRNDQ